MNNKRDPSTPLRSGRDDNDKYKILGIDPGLQKTGWGLVQSQGNQLRFVASGLIKTNAKEPLPKRLAILHEGLADVIKAHHPDQAAMEEIFVNKNPSSTLKLGQARGALLTVPALYGLDVTEYATNKIKKSVVGSGHAAKQQIEMMVKTLLPTCGEITEDEADALAVAICHAHYGTTSF